MIFLTNFADQAVILPLVTVIAAILLAQRQWHAAAAWLLATGSVLGAVLVLKLLGYACGWLVPAFGPDRLALSSPSGHTASAALAYGGIAALLSTRRRAGTVWTPPRVALLAAVAAALLIGATRVRLGAHSWFEVVLAAAIGIAGAAAFSWFASGRAGRPVALVPAAPLLAGVVLVVALFHGYRLPAESLIQVAAGELLRRWVPACQPGQG